MAGQDNCALQTSANWKLVRTQSLHAFNIFIENKTYFLSDQDIFSLKHFLKTAPTNFLARIENYSCLIVFAGDECLTNSPLFRETRVNTRGRHV